MLVKKTDPIKLEFIVRGYMTGSTSTSIWPMYKGGNRNMYGLEFRDGYQKNQKLDEIILTPTTKDEHDELISEKEIIEKNIMSQKDWDTCSNYAFKIFELGQKIASEHGLILVDTKYEFGVDENGNILLVDELHTPDSSRFWIEHNYLDNLNNNKEPESIDKEIVRKDLNIEA